MLRANNAGRPNPTLHSDPACIAFRSLSASRFLGFVQRLGAGVAGELHSLGLPMFDHLNLPADFKPSTWNWFVFVLLLVSGFESVISHRYLSAIGWFIFSIVVLLMIFQFPRTKRNARVVVLSLMSISVCLWVTSFIKNWPR